MCNNMMQLNPKSRNLHFAKSCISMGCCQDICLDIYYNYVTQIHAQWTEDLQDETLCCGYVSNILMKFSAFILKH